MKLALGTVQFGMHYGIANTTGKTAAAEVKQILSLASQNGIDVLDTAAGYGDAENVLGAAGVGDFKIVSKFLPAGNEDAFAKQLATSLRDLKAGHLYGYLAHRPQDLLINKWQWGYLQQQKAGGIIDKIGFSLNEPSELHQLLAAGFFPDLVQVPYNFLDRRFEKDLVELKARGTEVHTRSAFLQGLFFTDTDSLPPFFDTIKPVIKNFKNRYHLVSEALLSFALQKHFIDKVIIGVETAAQLEQNIKAAASKISVEMELPFIDEKILMPSNWPKQ